MLYKRMDCQSNKEQRIIENEQYQISNTAHEFISIRFLPEKSVDQISPNSSFSFSIITSRGASAPVQSVKFLAP